MPLYAVRWKLVDYAVMMSIPSHFLSDEIQALKLLVLVMDLSQKEHPNFVCKSSSRKCVKMSDDMCDCMSTSHNHFISYNYFNDHQYP